ncbi:MAG: hypothetical protein WCA07_17350 [Gloeobacterales cyanobacterium]
MTFQQDQIVCMRVAPAVLYCVVRSTSTNLQGEVLCWARPLFIQELEEVHDVRCSVDVLCPLQWFEPTFDVEVLNHLPLLDWEQAAILGLNAQHRQRVSHFIRYFITTESKGRSPLLNP